MRICRFFDFGSLLVLLLGTLHSQQNVHQVQKDQQAMHSLNRAVAALGGDKKASLVDVQISGTLSLPSAPDVVTATFVAKARGEDWALDTTSGSRVSKYRVLHGAATLQDESSTKFFHPSISYGTRLEIFPLFHRWTELDQTGSSVTLVGPTTLDGESCMQVHVRAASSNVDSLHANQHHDVDVLLDSASGNLRAIRHKAMLGMPNPRAMEVENRFDEYKQLGGLTLPTRVTRYLRGQPVLVYHITAVQTNNGFTDEDFRNHRGAGQ